MRQSDILGALARRWYVALLGIVATIALCLGATRVVPPTYEIEASLLLLPPSVVAPQGGNGGNPFLGLGGLGPAASVLGRAMTDSDKGRELKSRGATGKYSVDPDLSTSGPVLLVVAVDTTRRGAVRTLNVVLDEAPRTLASLQRSIGAPQRSLLTTSVINQDSRPVKVQKSQVRAVIVAALAGLTGTVFGVALLDSFLDRRRRRDGDSEAGDGMDNKEDDGWGRLKDPSPPAPPAPSIAVVTGRQGTPGPASPPIADARVVP